MVRANKINVTTKALNIGRAGLKTSEFWIALITAICAVLAEYGGVDVPWQAITTIVVYMVSRTVLKSVVAKNGGMKNGAS